MLVHDHILTKMNEFNHEMNTGVQIQIAQPQECFTRHPKNVLGIYLTVQV